MSDEGVDVETIAAQWAQEIRFRALGAGVDTGAAVAVMVDGTMHTLADALRAAGETTHERG